MTTNYTQINATKALTMRVFSPVSFSVSGNTLRMWARSLCDGYTTAT